MVYIFSADIPCYYADAAVIRCRLLMLDDYASQVFADARLRRLASAPRLFYFAPDFALIFFAIISSLLRSLPSMLSLIHAFCLLTLFQTLPLIRYVIFAAFAISAFLSRHSARHDAALFIDVIFLACYFAVFLMI